MKRQGWSDEELEIATPPAHPTRAKPGSAEKVETLRERYSKGEQFWHPSDACDVESMKAINLLY